MRLEPVLDASDVLLNEHGIKTNVISMPCLDVFLEQGDDYQSKVIKLNDF